MKQAKKMILINLMYKIASRLFYVIGVVYMFLPIFTQMTDVANYFIIGGALISTLGVMLMGMELETKINKVGLTKIKKKIKPSENVLDDVDF